MKKVYEKLFSRDFSLPSVEAWVRGESIAPKGWTEEKQQHLPYIIAERSDDTIHFYYDMKGLEWVCSLLIKLSKEDKNFISKIEKNVIEKLRFIRPVYEEEKVLDSPDLKRLLKEYEEGFPWFEAMWLYFEMDQSRVKGLDLQSLQELRRSTDRLCGGTDAVIRKSLINLYPELGELSSVLRTKEVFSGNIPSKEALQKRYKGYFFSNDQLLTGVTKSIAAKKFGIHFASEEIKKVRMLTGNVASAGKVRGYVRRLMEHRQIDLLKEGEILVSPMTIPDFLPAMKKAAAFVTDEGGILCHAAIVAREMGKPCIVGTKFATQLLRDGHLVEVDANHGIVTIL